MKKNKREKHQHRHGKQSIRDKVLYYVLSVLIILAIFFLNSFNHGFFLNDGYLYLVYIAVALLSGFFLYTAKGKVAQLSLRKRFLAVMGVSILVWGALNAYNMYYSGHQPLHQQVVNVDDISIRSRSGNKVTLYFNLDGRSNTYSGSGLKAIPITYDNLELYKKILRLKLVYRKGILGSYVLIRPVKVIR